MAVTKFWIFEQYVVNRYMSKTVKDRRIVTTDDNRMPYVLYRIAPLPMTLLDLGGYFSYLENFIPVSRKKIAYLR